MDVLFSEISRKSRAFPVPNDAIDFLNSPKEFYDFIINSINASQKRIYISSLYIGNDQLSRKLVTCSPMYLNNFPG